MAAKRKGGGRCTPTVLKKLRRTIEPTREKKRQFEPVPEVDLSAEPPHWMTDDQQISWRYAMTHAPRGLLKAIDQGQLVIWCEAESRHRIASMAQARIDRGKEWPFLTPKKDGTAGVSPYIRIINHAALVMMRAAGELGFTPASRPRIALLPGGAPPPTLDEDGAPIDPWDELDRLHGRAA